jgi:hypothetical protein
MKFVCSRGRNPAWLPDNAHCVSNAEDRFDELFRDHYAAVLRFVHRRVEPDAVGRSCPPRTADAKIVRARGR